MATLSTPDGEAAPFFVGSKGRSLLHDVPYFTLDHLSQSTDGDGLSLSDAAAANLHIATGGGVVDVLHLFFTEVQGTSDVVTLALGASTVADVSVSANDSTRRPLVLSIDSGTLTGIVTSAASLVKVFGYVIQVYGL